MRRISAFAIVGLLVLIFGVGQLVLPGVAASVLRDRLSKSGHVLSVQVSAFPAIELLWHKADKVVVRMADYRSGVGHLSNLLGESAAVDTLNASVGVFHSGLLTLHNVRLIKQGQHLLASANLLERDLRAAVPFLQSVSFVSSSGNSLTLRGTADVLGVSASVPATVAPQNGKLVVTPDVPFGGLATVTVFDNPHLQVESVAGQATPGGLAVSAHATLR